MEKTKQYENVSTEKIEKYQDIAIIGVGLRLSSATNLSEYWDIINNKINCIEEYPEFRQKQVRDMALMFSHGKEPQYYPGSYIGRIDEFDNSFFKISPKEASLMDPVQRVFLETILATFDDAGYTHEKLKKTKTGVYVGYTSSSMKDNYVTDIVLHHPELLKYALTGNMAPLLPSRVSHLLDLHGPTMVIDTACSSSLVALHEACRGIIDGACDMAVAGGIKFNILPLVLESTKLGIEASDGKTRAFDSGADGSSIGEGCVTIMIKPLKQAEKDHDTIYAVIKGSAINHDGTASGLTAPNPAAQAMVIQEAWKAARINPEDIDYIEAHGTATALGDPIEIQGIIKAFSEYTDKKQFCGIGTAKSNLGHTHECAGLAGLVKVVAALNHHVMPPTINFSTPNQNIDFINSPVYINTISREWKRNNHVRTSGVSAFGLSGTNAHFIIQEYDKPVEEIEVVERPTVLCFAADSDYSTVEYAKEYLNYLENNYETFDYYNFCYNVNRFRNIFNKRFALVVTGKNDLRDKLIKIVENGQGSIPEEYIYYGEIKKTNNDMQARREFKRLVSENSKIMNSVLLSKTTDLNELAKVCEAYINGAEPDWDTIYADYAGIKLHLPTYPFQKNSLWIPALEHLPDKKFYYKKFWKLEALNFTNKKMDHLVTIKFDENTHSYHDDLIKNAEKVSEISLKKGENILVYKDEIIELLKTATHIVVEDENIGATGIDNYNELVSTQELQVQNFLYLSHWLVKMDRQIKVAVITDYCVEVTGNEDIIKPEKSCIYGYGKCISRENKKVKYCSIDIDADTTNEDIINEILSDTKEEIVTYRDGKRYIEGFTEVQLTPKNTDILKPESVYVVTGGLGGIGFEVSKELCKRVKDATIVLINRSKLPFNQQGDIEDEEISEKIFRYNTLKGLAKNLGYYACDVSDYDQMQKVINEVKEKYGHINGVIHGAGVGGGVEIEYQDESHFMGMVKPKVYGAYILDDLTKDEPLDFFVMFSSIATIFSSTKLSDYTYANTYLDTFCNYRRKYRKGNTFTINWSTWSEIGMSVKHNFVVDTLFKTVKSAQGVNGFFDVLFSNEVNVVVGELNLDTNIAFLLSTYQIQYSDYILDRLNNLKNANSNKSVASNVAAADVKIVGGAYGEIEKKIVAACREVLGYDEIDINDNFFELGADSILLGRIFSLLADQFDGGLEVTDLFAYPSVKQLSEYLSSKTTVESKREQESRERVQSVATVKTEHSNKDVAIIGIGLDFPCAKNLEEYWDLLSNGICAVRDIPYERSRDIKNHFFGKGLSLDKMQFNKCAYLDEINRFDYSLFGMSPREARLIDPINRLFLQCSWSAIEDSGYGGDKLRGSNTGVFLGYTANLGNMYSRILYEIDSSLFGESLPVNQVSMAASRIAYVNDLKGPSMVIDTACSSSLVAIHMACQQIRTGNCEMALAGGASITLAPMKNGYTVGFESSEEKTRSFSEGSTGTAVGEGVGVVLLKSLDAALRDHDCIYGVVKGSASNQDGSSFGIAAPNYLAQSEAIRRAWIDADVDPESISYVEAHGTGTQLGDPIEVKGITHAFREYTNRKQFVALGTVKPNIGHLNEASGISGVIKLMLMMKHHEFTPCMFFNTPNTNIDFINSPLYLVPERKKWESNGKPLRAGINGLGMSGTNCHIILEEAPTPEAYTLEQQENNIFTLSCQNWKQLQIMIKDTIKWLKENPLESMTAICNTMNTGRKHHNYRLAVIAHDVEDLIQKLQKLRFNEYKHIEEEQVFVGRYNVVSEDKTNREEYELTAEEHNALNEKAEQVLQRIVDTKALEDTKVLLQLYVRGAQVNWQQLYAWETPKLHMPHYPFKKEYCWIEEPVQISEIDSMGLNGLFHHVVWRNDVMKDSDVKPDKNKTLLVFYDVSKRFVGVTEQLRMMKNRVIEVELGQGYKKQGEDLYTVDGEITSMKSLFEDLKDVKINKIIHFAAIAQNKLSEYHQIQESLNHGFFHIINMIKGMVDAHYNQEFELITIANNAYGITKKDECTNPESAVVLSLGKVVEQEYTNIDCRALDIDDSTTVNEIVNEIFLKGKQVYIVGYRNHKRYSESLEEADVEPTQEMIREDGTYVITGGLGDIGLEVAKYLSEKGCANIVLFGRNGFYPEDEWDNKEFSDYIKNKVRILREIKASDSKLHIYAADVTDYDALKNVIDDIHSKCGKIHGVFHSAGLAGAGFILRKDRANFESVLDPKIVGTWNLDELTREDKLDFMLFCTSAVTMSGEAGQSDYVAANTFLDAYCDYRTARGDRTFAINWVSWKETGMSVRYGINVDSITKAIPTEQAIDGVDKLLKSAFARVMIGQYTVGPNLIAVLKYSRNKVSPNMMKVIEQLEKIYNVQDENANVLREAGREVAQVRNGKLLYIPHSEKDKGGAAKSSNINVTRKTDSLEEIQENLIKIYSAILGYEDIDIYDNFFEVGGDSIMLTRMQVMIDGIYPNMINVAKLFEYTSVFSLANYIKEEVDKTNSTSKRQENTSKQEVAVTTSNDSVLDKYLDTEYDGSLSGSQRRMFIMQKFSKDKYLYNNPFAFLFVMPEGYENVLMDKDYVLASLKKLVSRYEILRTCFVSEAGNTKCKICEVDDLDLDIQYKNVERFEDINYKELLTKFNLSKAPLFKITIISLANGEYVMFFDIHHIITDGTSSRIINKDFQALLRGEELPEVKYQYRHYVQYEHDVMGSEKYEEMREYWSDKLKGIEVENYLPTTNEKVKNGVAKTLIRKVDFHFNKSFSSSEFSLLLAAFNILMYKYSGKEDIVVGVPSLGRMDKTMMNMPGMFINILPLRNKICTSDLLRDFIKKISINIAQDLEQQLYPYEQMVKLYRAETKSKESDLFRILFEYEGASLDIMDDKTKKDDFLIPIESVKYDVNFLISYKNGDMYIKVDYESNLYSDEFMNQVIDQYIALLKVINGSNENDTVSSISDKITM